MYARNWEDFVSVDRDGFVVQYNPRIDISAINWTSIASTLGEISATATSTPGILNGVEDGDLIAFNLTAGQTYSFDYRGAVGGVSDPYLFLLNSANQILAEDDDGGLGTGSLITYTPTVTGTYYLYATSYTAAAGGSPAADFGAYAISSWTREADVPGTTNVLASLPGAVALGVGTYYGNIDVSGDNDYFRINVIAGQAYNFTLAGGAASNAELSTPGNTAATLSLYQANGTLIASNLSFESAVNYLAPANATIYVRAAGLAGTTGGYTLDVQQIDLATRDPLESLNWDRADNIDTVLVNGVPTAYVYFGGAGETFGERNADGTPLITSGWTSVQIAAVMTALQTDYTPITGINYVLTTDVAQAEFRMLTVPTATYGARFYPQDPAYGSQQGIGTFNLASGGFGALPQSLDRGGYSYAVILHEFGHAHGIAHPHDTGGGSEVMLGVTGATGSLGFYNLNQGVYTVMSYNDAWRLNPDGPSAFTAAGIDNGWSATLGAFDIAVLQARYGQHAYNTGDNVYLLSDVADDAFYQTIWDTGGTDTIAYGGTFNAQIDLTAATLDYSPTGGGVLSFLYNPRPFTVTNSFLVRGGYTIANDVVIENATGGSGNDILIGNSAANVLTGNAGNDSLMGRDGNDLLNGGAGDDTLDGGNGVDTATYAGATSGVTVDLAIAVAQATGGAGSDTLTGIENLIGSSFNDTLRGDAGNNALTGGAGNDVLTGRDGNDLLSGGAGDDILDGGNGNDTATYAGASSGVTVNLALTGAQATGGAGSDTLTGIENLIGSSFADTLRGNSGNNFLFGAAGNDLLIAGAGNDVVRGGDGLDVIQLGAGNDIFVAEVGTTQSTLRMGSMSVDIITDFGTSGRDLIDLSGFDQSFQFRGHASSRNVGDLTFRTFGNINAAENALGIDIDGNPGASNVSGPVTVVFGNLDGGDADFAIILLNRSGVTANDFIFGDDAATAAYSTNQVSDTYRAFEDHQVRATADLYFA